MDGKGWNERERNGGNERNSEKESERTERLEKVVRKTGKGERRQNDTRKLQQGWRIDVSSLEQKMKALCRCDR